MKLLRSRILILAAATAIGAAALATGTAQATTATATSRVAAADFYTPPSPLPAGADGDVIRHEPMNFYNGSQATAQRIMYLSRNTHGERIAVTGAILTPRSPWFGIGARPIIGYGVGTQGMGDQCAPSKIMGSFMEYEDTYLSGLLSRGYAIAVTDYEGLGTPGNHTYVNRASEAYALLNVVRAAQRLPAADLPDAGPVATFGYSQGGGASAAAVELAASYAPELKIKGGYAGAPPAELKAVGRSLDGHYAAAFLGYAVISLDTAYPELGIPALLNERGTQLFAEVAKECIAESLAKHAFTRSETLTKDGRPVTAYMDEEPFNSRVNEQRIGLRKPAVPTLVLHSSGDDIVPYEQGRQMARDWCARGATVQFTTLSTATHVGAIPETANHVFPWLEQRFAGIPAGGNCGRF
ncbi:MAG: lipase family protein [Micromonosporaceae bacterium]